MMKNDNVMPITRIVTEILPRCAVSVVQISPCSNQYRVYMEISQGAMATVTLSALAARDLNAFNIGRY